MRTDIRFLLNGQPRRITGIAPHTMLLDWLRSQGLTAVKEGCAEGDCGACSVLLGVPAADGRSLTWLAVNSCILMVPQVDGCAVVTAEGLVGADGVPHPAQKALAETHGTQCGFCSPGFAIALAALSRRPERDDETILDAIAGNLCRCTGYQPILQAARTLPIVAATPDEAAMAAALCADRAEPLDYRADGRRFAAPQSLDAALAVLEEHPEAWILSGGTDLGLRVTKRHEEPACVLSLAHVPELHEIRRDRADTVIGAAVSYTDALEAITALAPAFGGMVRRIGAAQIRAMGTLGGNIGNASPIGDTLPPLIALGATVETISVQGWRSIPMEDFIVGYRKTVLAAGEIIAAVRVPIPDPKTWVCVYKVARRIDQDISAVSAAFALEVADGRVVGVRVAYGGVADRPVRARDVEAALTGRVWSLETVRAAAPAVRRSVSPIDDARGSAAYRTAVCVNLLERLWWETAGPDGVPSTLGDLEEVA
ncbi:xanthine dehydrogenase small subunit [Shumkonia mesophila]|uniref:xanthine dehydrogenase small subunit n=1 Tax=Shumkonia mesophila TaxID=2838854 RepID=UPI0029352AFD|nr:xanthine dehydrogenase small subunit [Shumkonia mesophila]